MGSDHSLGRMIKESPPNTEKQSGVVSGQEISKENNDVLESREHKLDKSNKIKKK